MNDKHLGIFLSPELHQKFKYISKYDGRSLRAEALYLVRKYITEFEAEHGKIKTEVVGEAE